MNNIAAIIVTYNRKELLSECIEALLKQSKNDFDIFIIDNASTDGTECYIKKYLENSRINYINTEQNLGGAGGFNFGIKQAYMRGYDYFWIMDDDTIVETTCLEELSKADKLLDGNWGFLCSQIIWTDSKRSLCIMNRQIICKDWYNDSGILSEGMLRVRQATFVSIMIKREAVKKLGLPIKEFFIWNDDFEYTDRISKEYKCFVVSKSRAVHKIKNNIEANIEMESLDRLWRYSYLFRNGFFIARRNGFKSIVRYHINCFSKIKKVWTSKCKNKMKKTFVMLKSLFKGYFFFPDIEYIEDCNVEKLQDK